jgi:hypothetical protein
VESVPLLIANQNHVPAAVLRNGVLSIRLEIAKGEWRPNAKDGIALAVYAFGEAGRTLQNRGPPIRLRQPPSLNAH